MRPSKGKEIWNKKTHMIVFYEKDDETYVCSFDNIRDILKFRGLPYSKQNYDLIAVEIYRALKRQDNYTEMLGRPMHVYLIDLEDE